MQYIDGTFLNEVRREVEQLCRDTLPLDLPKTTPLYVCWLSEIPSLQDGGFVLGLAYPYVDLIARDHIGDRWRGRGPGFLLNDRALYAVAVASGANNPVWIRSQFRSNAVYTALHELGHVAEAGFDRTGEWERSPEVVNCLTDQVKQTVVKTTPADFDANDQQRQHGPAWIRACCHLFHRAQAHWPFGVLPSLTPVCDTENYGLSVVRYYRDALGDEPARLAYLSLADVLRSPAPTAFTKLYQHDRARALATLRDRCTILISQAPDAGAKGFFTMSQLESIVDELAEAAQKRTMQRTLDYWRLIRGIAQGERPLPAKIDGVLAAAGKTVEDLKASVLLIDRRTRQAAQIAAATQAATQRPALVKKHEKALAEFEAAQKRFADLAGPIRYRLSEIEAQENAAGSLPRSLVVDCLAADGPHPDLFEKYQTLNNRIVYELQRDVNLLKKSSAGRAAGEHDVERGMRPGSSMEGNAHIWVREGKNAIAIADAADKELPGAIKALADAQGELAKIEAEMQSP